MVEGPFRHLPVVENGRVRGILSMRDVTGWLIHRLQADDDHATART
jgi:CBS domain-containing protein